MSAAEDNMERKMRSSDSSENTERSNTEATSNKMLEETRKTQAPAPEARGSQDQIAVTKLGFPQIAFDPETGMRTGQDDKYTSGDEIKTLRQPLTAEERKALDAVLKAEEQKFNLEPQKTLLGSDEQKMYAYAKSNFDKIDSDGDGQLQAGELEEYANQNADNLTPEQKQYLEELKNKSALNDLADDKPGDTDTGISRADLQMASGIDVLRTQFRDVDKGNNGQISGAEIDKFIAAHKELTEDEKAGLLMLKDKPTSQSLTPQRLNQIIGNEANTDAPANVKPEVPVKPEPVKPEPAKPETTLADPNASIENKLKAIEELCSKSPTGKTKIILNDANGIPHEYELEVENFKSGKKGVYMFDAQTNKPVISADKVGDNYRPNNDDNSNESQHRQHKQNRHHRRHR